LELLDNNPDVERIGKKEVSDAKGRPRRILNEVTVPIQMQLSRFEVVIDNDKATDVLKCLPKESRDLVFWSDADHMIIKDGILVKEVFDSCVKWFSSH